MGRNHWNPQRWHRNHLRPRRHSPMWGPAIVVALALVTGGVAATQGLDLGADSDQVGICHATGGVETPFVYLVVARDGAEHGHHAAHEDDIMDVQSEADCPTTASPTSTDEDLCGDHTVNETDSADAGAEPAAPTAANATNETNETQEPTDPDLEGLCDADVGVNHTASVNGSWVRFDMKVESIGTGEADDVLLDASMPDVGRAWRIVGAAPEGCLLQGRDLSCEFGDLVPGASRALSLKAARCVDDCGDDLEATATVSAHNDGNATNNEATAILIVEDCPRGNATTPTASPSPAPATSTAASPTPSPAPTNNTTQPTNTTSPPANNTGNQTNGTQPGNSTPPAPPPAPQTSDASVAQRADQTDEQVVLTIVVRSVGDASAQNVSLMDTLPDVRRSWHLSGADAASCTLDGRWLNCWFGDLAPGESRTISLKAYTDRLACGQHLTNNVTIASDGDANASNNRSGASIEARSC
jgi:uncharacterized repeat protein (TIGR01451 family)